MQINHNIRAMVTQQSLSLNDNAMARSLEKLSTGLRINRAQDDAAGLAMSEQMRTQIRGLGKAKRNAQDGQAALQIAEGALGEITNMLQRQKELAVQSANDTLTSTERMYLNDEFQALTKEVNRIANNTDYNGKNVLLFDVDPNKSFAATKLDPYNKDIAYLNAANVLYKAFGQNLGGAFASLTATISGNSGANAINKSLASINGVISNLKGILTDGNIKAALVSINAIGLSKIGSDLLKGDLLHTNTVSYMNAHLDSYEQTASNMKTLKALNTFLRDVSDALDAYNATNAGEFKAKAGATAAITYTYAKIANSDISGVKGFSNIGIGSFDRIIKQLSDAKTATTEEAKIAKLGAIFSSNASVQMQTDLKNVLDIDVNKMAVGSTRDKIAAWQESIKEFKDSYKIYSEADIATGSAASEVLHVGPNYSSGLGGSAANQIKVNYTAVDVKGLGLEAQMIDSREGATKAIDRVQDAIKVVSGNRASIGTYINRLDYTVNNIASMEYNIQDAESRIRDTDFATETTNFTRNQIMVQAATSMLAQANSLPQSVLGLLG